MLIYLGKVQKIKFDAIRMIFLIIINITKYYDIRSFQYLRKNDDTTTVIFSHIYIFRIINP